ncbi:hypothetical protein EB796_002530 [Bugula neritina]|uniref:Uncharacterized protein n=1 Tax=Bugula neritina TaxID=10212 RepID=A0A7J7KLX8_BUGNE|nr:hypothetical protein EB796_002530 [Bugula neritina]
MQAPDMSCQMKQVQQNNIPLIQPQQANYNSADMIVQTADQPNIPPDVDLWPTEITMLPGPSQAHPSTVHQLPYPTADTNPSSLKYGAWRLTLAAPHLSKEIHSKSLECFPNLPPSKDHEITF